MIAAIIIRQHMVRIDHDLSNRRFILKRPRVPPFCIHVSKGNVTRNFSLERCPFTGSGNMSGANVSRGSYPDVALAAVLR
ncbi:hypothetical protein HDF13_002338 [Edaphobacter lichenicola]|uniref:Uncharacterized protein n=1 Tax=Tunturiibacter gelidiferens TaxID=3069689 RepID=A0ACC5NZI7_9BACT|nr:hypothetical protein [Edaphobacter lichenicola]